MDDAMISLPPETIAAFVRWFLLAADAAIPLNVQALAEFLEAAGERPPYLDHDEFMTLLAIGMAHSDKWMES